MTREHAFEKLKVLLRARLILMAEGACVGTVHERNEVHTHIRRVCDRLRMIAKPGLVE